MTVDRRHPRTRQFQTTSLIACTHRVRVCIRACTWNNIRTRCLRMGFLFEMFSIMSAVNSLFSRAACMLIYNCRRNRFRTASFPTPSSRFLRHVAWGVGSSTNPLASYTVEIRFNICRSIWFRKVLPRWDASPGFLSVFLF